MAGISYVRRATDVSLIKYAEKVDGVERFIYNKDDSIAIGKFVKMDYNAKYKQYGIVLEKTNGALVRIANSGTLKKSFPESDKPEDYQHLIGKIFEFVYEGFGTMKDGAFKGSRVWYIRAYELMRADSIEKITITEEAAPVVTIEEEAPVTVTVVEPAAEEVEEEFDL